MNKLLSLLIVSTVIGNSTPVLAMEEKGLDEGIHAGLPAQPSALEYEDLFSAVNSFNPDQSARATLKAINIFIAKDSPLFEYETYKFNVTYSFWDICGEGLGDLNASISNVALDAQSNDVTFNFNVSEGNFAGYGTATVNQEALTEAGKEFFRAYRS